MILPSFCIWGNFVLAKSDSPAISSPSLLSSRCSTLTLFFLEVCLTSYAAVSIGSLCWGRRAQRDNIQMRQQKKSQRHASCTHYPPHPAPIHTPSFHKTSLTKPSSKVILLTISRWQQQSIKSSMGPSWEQGLWAIAKGTLPGCQPCCQSPLQMNNTQCTAPEAWFSLSSPLDSKTSCSVIAPAPSTAHGI
jgi:hypothetical protein